MIIRQGATKPDLTLTLSDEARPDGVVPLDEAIGVNVIGYRDGAEVFRTPAVGVTGLGDLTHLWSPAHTNTPGVITLEVAVQWADGPQVFPIDETIEVLPVGALTPLVTLTELVNHMSGITLDPYQRADGEKVLRGVQRGLERALNRRFTPGTVTETVYPDPVTGFAMFSRTPVREILSIAGQTPIPGDSMTRISPSGAFLVGYLGYGYVGAPFGVVVTYTGGGGGDPDDLADVELAIAEKAAIIMRNRHDDARSPADLESRAPEPSGDWKWTNDELDHWGMSRLRRKVAI